MPPRLRRLPHRSAGPFTLALARTPRARLLGLAGLRGVPPGTALVLGGTRSVHTCGMRFALDLVWLGRRGEPLRVDEGVGPRRLRACRGARAVAECRAGEGRALAATLRAGGSTLS
ncbi:DUF192 domain-containing protein [Conexibacter sp. SYSU D00693]|uniref:DUF192 domain-containing protein n=1 Tax=Conexibacter sp. SYSU D00693 TaxID=2812560 RepID=UPI00196A26AE|nr:DUF192 domain-containing protein [Conexibacter sp. SYSU D00693]